jgi:predicted nucleotidyltransferase
MPLQLTDVLQKKGAILEIAQKYNAHSLRLFKIVSQEINQSACEVDFLCEMDIDLGIFPVMEMEEELADLLGVQVYVFPRYLLKEEFLTEALQDGIAF